MNALPAGTGAESFWSSPMLVGLASYLARKLLAAARPAPAPEEPADAASVELVDAAPELEQAVVSARTAHPAMIAAGSFRLLFISNS